MKYTLEWLNAEFNRGEQVKFLCFWGHSVRPGELIGKTCFSQWFERPFSVGGIIYPTAEHWMMAHKALLFGDEVTAQLILGARTPGEAKSLGRELINFDEAVWLSARYEIVREGNFHKFRQHPVLTTYLKQTGNRVLVEASPLDTIWGIGLAQDDPRAVIPHEWLELNLLGFALMEVRDQLLTL